MWGHEPQLTVEGDHYPTSVYHRGAHQRNRGTELFARAKPDTECSVFNRGLARRADGQGEDGGKCHAPDKGQPHRARAGEVRGIPHVRTLARSLPRTAGILRALLKGGPAAKREHPQ